MTLQSMTGFARSEGQSGRYRWAWELRSVNGKGLDVRLRLPTGFERLEGDAKIALSAHLNRGNVQANLSVQISEERVEASVNQTALDAILALKAGLGEKISAEPLSINSLLSIKGVIEFRDRTESAEELAALDADILAGLASACAAMVAMRVEEGRKLGQILGAQVDVIAGLVALVEADPSRSPEAIRQKLANQIEAILESQAGIDRDRLAQEVALLATKADIREELDRLGAHVAAARQLLAAGGPVGRKLDFLAQEFNRESNTVCSKSNAVAVTNAGIELKVVIDQFREQIQNLE